LFNKLEFAIKENNLNYNDKKSYHGENNSVFYITYLINEYYLNTYFLVKQLKGIINQANKDYNVILVVDRINQLLNTLFEISKYFSIDLGTTIMGDIRNNTIKDVFRLTIVDKNI
jgi:hypothetical protein